MNFSHTRTLQRLSMMSSQPLSMYSQDRTESFQIETFTPPKNFRLGPSVYRTFTCVPGCSACCMQGPLTLDFIPTERAWLDLPDTIKSKFSDRFVNVNGQTFLVHSLDKPKNMCHFLVDHAGGKGCGIWNTHPLECFAAARLQVQKHGDDAILLKKGFAREWRWEVRAQCEYSTFDWPESEKTSDLLVLSRYQEWADYFHIPTIIPQLTEEIELAYRERSPRSFSIALS